MYKNNEKKGIQREKLPFCHKVMWVDYKHMYSFSLLFASLCDLGEQGSRVHLLYGWVMFGFQHSRQQTLRVKLSPDLS